MRISDWSSDVCSSDLLRLRPESLDPSALRRDGGGAHPNRTEHHLPQRPRVGRTRNRKGDPEDARSSRDQRALTARSMTHARPVSTYLAGPPTACSTLRRLPPRDPNTASSTHRPLAHTRLGLGGGGHTSVPSAEASSRLDRSPVALRDPAARRPCCPTTTAPA